ncbi:hypothetical protein EJ02DRAFT_357758, partial [Clathrospora elynae]
IAALPVRSAVLKQCTGGLVVRWVTTSESPLLYVFAFFALFCFTSNPSYVCIVCIPPEPRSDENLSPICSRVYWLDKRKRHP